MSTFNFLVHGVQEVVQFQSLDSKHNYSRARSASMARIKSSPDSQVLHGESAQFLSPGRLVPAETVGRRSLSAPATPEPSTRLSAFTKKSTNTLASQIKQEMVGSAPNTESRPPKLPLKAMSAPATPEVGRDSCQTEDNFTRLSPSIVNKLFQSNSIPNSPYGKDFIDYSRRNQQQLDTIQNEHREMKEQITNLLSEKKHRASSEDVAVTEVRSIKDELLAKEKESVALLQETIKELSASLKKSEEASRDRVKAANKEKEQLIQRHKQHLSKLETELRESEEKNFVSLHENTRLMKIINQQSAKEQELQSALDTVTQQLAQTENRCTEQSQRISTLEQASENGTNFVPNKFEDLRRENTELSAKMSALERTLALERAEKHLLVEALLNIKNKNVSPVARNSDGSVVPFRVGESLELSVSTLTSYDLSNCTSNDELTRDRTSKLSEDSYANWSGEIESLTNGQHGTVQNKVSYNFTSVVMKKVTAESAASIARCELKLEDSHYQIAHQQEMITALQEALAEREAITEQLAIDNNKVIESLRMELQRAVALRQLEDSSLGDGSSTSDRDVKNWPRNTERFQDNAFQLSSEREKLLEQIVILRNELKISNKQVQDVKGAMTTALQSADTTNGKLVRELQDKIAIIEKQKDELAMESRKELNYLRQQAVTLQELLTKERDERQRETVKEKEGWTSRAGDQGPGEMAEVTKQLRYLEGKMKKAMQALKEREFEVQSRKKACDALRNECDSLHKANEAFKKVIKSIQGELERSRRESVILRLSSNRINQDAEKHNKEIQELTEILNISKGETETLRLEVERLNSSVKDLQTKLKAAATGNHLENNQTLLKHRDHEQRPPTESHFEKNPEVEGRLSTISVGPGEEWFHNSGNHSTLTGAQVCSPPNTKLIRTSRNENLYQRNSDMSKYLCKAASLSTSDLNSTMMTDCRESALLERQSLISILSLDEERNSMLSDDYLVDSLRLQAHPSNKVEGQFGTDFSSSTSNSGSQEREKSGDSSHNSNDTFDHDRSSPALGDDKLVTLGGTNDSLSTSISSIATQVGELKHLEPPEWAKDQLVTNCAQCMVEFSILNRRHHCRNCGGIFCSSCSRYRISLPWFKIHDKVRVCVACSKCATEASQPLMKYVDQ